MIGLRGKPGIIRGALTLDIGFVHGRNIHGQLVKVVVAVAALIVAAVNRFFTVCIHGRIIHGQIY